MIKQLWQKIFKKKEAAEEIEQSLTLVPIEQEAEEIIEEIVEKKVEPKEQIKVSGKLVAKKEPLPREAQKEEEESQQIDSAVDEMPIHPRLKEAMQSKRKCPSCGSPLKIRSERRSDGRASLSFYVCTDHPNCRYRFPLTNV